MAILCCTVCHKGCVARASGTHHGCPGYEQQPDEDTSKKERMKLAHIPMRLGEQGVHI